MHGINIGATLRRTVGLAISIALVLYVDWHPVLRAALFGHWFMELVAIAIVAVFIGLVVWSSRNPSSTKTVIALIIGFLLGILFWVYLRDFFAVIGWNFIGMIVAVIVAIALWALTALDRSTGTASRGPSRFSGVRGRVHAPQFYRDWQHGRSNRP